MEFVLRIELGNDAMRSASDVARKLKEVGEDIKDGAHAFRGDLDKLEGFIRDTNGNTVGEWSFREETPVVVDQKPAHNHFGEIWVPDTCPGCAWLRDHKEYNKL
jgi:hypothetical protein